MADVIALMKVRADAKRLELKSSFAGPLPETIESDPTRLRQILINLVGNAIKFTESGGVQICRPVPAGSPNGRATWSLPSATRASA